jgi:LacI family transcriptional regulator
LDIARETKTSVSTVSRVLAGGAPAQRISVATRERIAATAERLGYRPNLLARSLRTRRSHTVALLVSDIANPFFGQLASLIEQSLHRHGYSLMLCNSGEDLTTEIEYLRLLPQKGIDGLILVSLLRSRKALLEHWPQDLPLVTVDRPIAGVGSLVASDQDQSARLLCDTLKEAGVEQVGLVSGPAEISTHRRRAEIFAECFEVIGRHEGPAQLETGREAYAALVKLSPPAFVCTNNFLAQGVLEALASARPAVMPVIGCMDEIPLMHLLPVPIVCSNQDVPRLAEGCVAQLMPLLRGEKARPEPIILQARAVTNPAFESLLSQARV